MDILYLMILCSVSLAVVFLIVFIVNVKKDSLRMMNLPPSGYFSTQKLSKTSRNLKKKINQN